MFYAMIMERKKVIKQLALNHTSTNPFNSSVIICESCLICWNPPFKISFTIYTFQGGNDILGY